MKSNLVPALASPLSFAAAKSRVSIPRASKLHPSRRQGLINRLDRTNRTNRHAMALQPLAAALAAGSMLALALGPGLQSASAQTLPSGLTVVQGQARQSSVGNTLTVTSSPGAVLNWNAFSIGAQSAVRFDQATASSQVLNRVVGHDPSQLLGRLSSNGKVWLLNPHGVLFGPGARVDVAGLVVSTLNLADKDWRAGRNLFSGTSDADIVNQGELRTPLGGRVMLVGASLRNEGLIEAPGGQIVLAAGRSVELLDTGSPNLSVKISAPQGSALNLGQLSAAGGRIDIHAAVVNQDGLVRAESLDAGAGGEIVLRATQALNLGAASGTVANGSRGGAVTMDAGSGTTSLSGRVSAIGDTGPGGQVQLLGHHVGLDGAASVDVSGASGGGQVLLGGGLLGKDASVRNADAVYFGPTARIAADATARGDGGRIILWSDTSTRAYGGLSARGGPQAGNGGFIETSGGWLDARPATLDTRAPRGTAGEWLIDPYDIVISNSFASQSGTFNIVPGSYFNASGDSAQILASDITRALEAGTFVTITTGTGTGTGTQAGHISFRDASIVPATVPAVGNLNVFASGNISVTRSVISALFSGERLNISLQAGSSGEGTVSVDSSILHTNGGLMDIAGVTRTAPVAVAIQASVLGADSGSLTLRGSHFGSAGATTGLLLSNALLTASGMNLVGGNYVGTPGSTGVDLLGSQLRSTESMRVTGIGATGVRLAGGNSLRLEPLSVNPNASMVIAGTSTAFGSGDGVLINERDNFPTLSSTGGASIQISAESFGVIGGNREGIRAIDDSGTTTRVASSGALELRSNRSVQLQNFGMHSDSTLILAAPNVAVSNVIGSESSLQTSAGSFSVAADHLTFGAGAQLRSDATSAPALLVTGFSGSGVRTVTNDAGSGALAAPRGRWLLYATDPLGSRSSGLDALDYHFRQYGALPGGGVLGSGNGLMFTSPQVATVQADVATRRYDATVTASVNNLRVQVLAGDQVSLPSPVAATFDTADAGSQKPVTIAGLVGSSGVVSLSITDVYGKPVYGYVLSSEVAGTVLPKPLELSVLALDKVYDATTFASGTLRQPPVGLVGAETVTVTLRGAFVDKNVGAQKSAVFDAQLADGAGGGKASNYSVVVPLEAFASITPAPLLLSGLSVADKVYDATTSATFSRAGNVAALAGDTVTLSAGTARFANKDAGTGVAVQLAGFTLAGVDAANYQLVLPALVASIATAPLQYVATPASRPFGAAVAPLGGAVTGFAGTETQASATTGVLAFTSAAGAQSPMGSYAVQGSGLSAANYHFEQAATNATALTVTAAVVTPAVNPVAPLTPLTQLTQLTQVTQASTVALAQALVLPTAFRSSTSSSTSSGLIDFMQAPAAGSQSTTPGTRPSFGGLRLRDMSQDAVAAVLAERDRFKKALFAEAIFKLEQDGSLADLPPCQSRDDAVQGKCLLTDALKQQFAGEPTAQTVLTRPAVPAAQTHPLQPLVQPLIQPLIQPSIEPLMQPSKQPSSAAPKSAVVAATPVPGSSLDLAQRRKVKSAALPQIERKVALVIGVDVYQDARIPPLSNAVNDARSVARLFETALGYETVVLANATRPDVVSAMNQLALELSPADSVIVYYAGHGQLVEATGLGYWQLADSDASQPQTWLSNADINRLVAQIGASQVALISDSCYSGSLVSDEQIRVTPAGLDPRELLTRKSVVVMSSGGNEPVADDARDGHSPFAWNLMHQLKQVNNWQQGGNVFARVRFAVARELPQRPKYGSSSAAGHEAGGDYLFERRQLEAQESKARAAP